MMRWRYFCGWFYWITICLIVSDVIVVEHGYYQAILPLDDAYLACIGGMMVCSILTLIYMWKAAAIEAGFRYALRQTVLAVLLTPPLLLGVYLVPILVKSDLLKWRRVEERKNPE